MLSLLTVNEGFMFSIKSLQYCKVLAEVFSIGNSPILKVNNSICCKHVMLGASSSQLASELNGSSCTCHKAQVSMRGPTGRMSRS
jgi:hypothetical protein